MKSWAKRIFFVIGGGVLGVAALILVGLLVLAVGYHQRIYPGITISQLHVGGLTQQQAKQQLSRQLDAFYQSLPTQFTDNNGNQYSIPLNPQVFTLDLDSSINQAFAYGRQISPQGIIQLISLAYQPPHFSLTPSIDQSWFDAVTASLSAQIDSPAVPPQIELRQLANQTQVQINPGHNGQVFDKEAWYQTLISSISTLTPPPAQIPLKLQVNALTQDQIIKTQATATTLLSKSITLTFTPSDNSAPLQWQLTGQDLIKFIRFDDSFDKQLIHQYLEGVATSVNRPPKDAKFQFDETTGKVTEFFPAENGITLDIPTTTELIYQALTQLAANQTIGPIQLAFHSTPPTISLGNANNLGIKDKLGVGTSTYKGSIPSRVHNVALAAARINGTLIPPGEEFSFLQAVGEISAATGYQTAYIIQNGRTQLGDGGGVCQDSTTVFRAALDAGLPITERHGHAYRVSYYEQDQKPGLDATIFSPYTDLKFKNDTPGYILVQAIADTANRRLTVTLYGTSDGRRSEITDHVIWDVTPPPPDIYIDDPTLPPGQVKQIDWKAPGTKAKFTYKVTRNGEVLQEKTFTTIYKPWAAVYLRGPQP